MSTHTRRRFLKAMGGVGTLAELAGCNGGSQMPESDLTTVDLADEGLEGGDDISALLSRHLVDGNEVVVPAGNYEWDGAALDRPADSPFSEDVSLVGDGGQVHLHQPDGHSKMIDLITESDATFRLENVTFRGVLGNGYGIRPAARSPSSEIIWKRVSFPDGAVSDTDSSGVYVGPLHEGHARFEDCLVRGFSDNGLYASAPAESTGGSGGTVDVIRGLYQNNNISNLRVGTGGVVDGPVCVHDGLAPTHPNGHNPRNLWIRGGAADQTIRNVDVYNVHPEARWPVRFNDLPPSSGTIENVRIRNDTPWRAIQASVDIVARWSGSGIHLTGTGNTSAPEGWIACRGPGCDEPRTSPRQPVEKDSGIDLFSQ